jgi:CRP-like cAMP-binding protein
MTAPSTVLERRLVAAGQKVFSEGDAGDAAYLIDTGRIAIFKHVEGKKIVLATLVKGAIFGEMAMVDDGPRMASAVALESSVLVAIPRQMFQQRLEGLDGFNRNLLHMLINNLRNVHKVYMARPRTVADVSRTLLDLLDQNKRYTATVGADQFSPEVERKIKELLAAIEKQIKNSAGAPRERRQDAIPSATMLPD